jgi:hypothetical protein
MLITPPLRFCCGLHLSKRTLCILVATRPAFAGTGSTLPGAKGAQGPARSENQQVANCAMCISVGRVLQHQHQSAFTCLRQLSSLQSYRAHLGYTTLSSLNHIMHVWVYNPQLHHHHECCCTRISSAAWGLPHVPVSPACASLDR